MSSSQKVNSPSTNEEAAALMENLYAELIGGSLDTSGDMVGPDSDDDRNLSVLLTRLLFLMFGDDAGLWDRGLFQRFIETRTTDDGSDLGSQLTALFQVLDTPESRRSPHLDEALRGFPYVNG
jgi:hypothetical protein